MVELNEFRKLLVYRVLKPDIYLIKLEQYVNNMLQLKLNSLKWKDIVYKTMKPIIINMDKNVDYSITSASIKIDKLLNSIAKKREISIKYLNCDNLTVTDLSNEIEKMKSGILLIKNLHLANRDVLEFIKSLCDYIGGLKNIFSTIL